MSPNPIPHYYPLLSITDLLVLLFYILSLFFEFPYQISLERKTVNEIKKRLYPAVVIIVK